MFSHSCGILLMSKVILELGSEGGSISIIQNDNGTYALRKQEMSYEFDNEPTTEVIDKIISLNSITDVFEILKANSNWLFLYPLLIAEEIKPLLIELINSKNDKRLNENWFRILYKK